MLFETLRLLSSRNRRLDFLTFSVSGLRDGLGPLLGVFLIQKTHWDAVEISSILAAAGFTNLLLQIPTGLLYDSKIKPNILVGLGGLCLAVSCYLTSTVPPYLVALFAQILVGAGGCLLSVGLPALSARSTTIESLRSRLARNEIFSKIGNFCSIGLMGMLSQHFNLQWMFYVIYAAATLVVINCLWEFAPDEETRFAADLSIEESAEERVAPVYHYFKNVLCNANLWRILIPGFVYQFSNASMFMIFEQQYVRRQLNGGVGIISSSLLVTQITIVVCCMALTRASGSLSAKFAFQVGMGLIMLRE